MNGVWTNDHFKTLTVHQINICIEKVITCI